MVKKIKIRQVHTNTLSCEPMLERCENGELLCVCQCGGMKEPAPDNRVLVFHSKDNGETWSGGVSIYPEVEKAVYCTEMNIIGSEITAYLSIHNGTFLDWECRMVKSYDCGYTWEDCGAPPYFPNYTFMRATLKTFDGRILIPYQTYPIDPEKDKEILAMNGHFWQTFPHYCESGVLESTDNGKNYVKHVACRMSMHDGWIWSEPTVADCGNGKIVMLLRKCGTGWLYRCESNDGGRTWGDIVQTDIPNPTNKPRLFNIGDGKIALIHTPNNKGLSNERKYVDRYPLQLWISDDGMQSWSEKITLTNFPGSYSYTDGIYEEGHIRFVIEHNRHTILFFDVEL